MDPQNEVQSINNIGNSVTNSDSLNDIHSNSFPEHEMQAFFEHIDRRAVLQRQTTIPEIEHQPLNEHAASSVSTRVHSRNRLSGQQNIREGFEQIRMRLDNTQEGQTFLSVAKNVLPFFVLFAARLFYDNFHIICHFIGLYGFFFQADFCVRKMVAGGISMRIPRIVFSLGYSLLAFFYINTFSLPNFEFSNTLRLNLLYYLNGDSQNVTMASTFYGVLIVDTSFKIITVVPKTLLVSLSKSHIPSAKKRKLLQVLEYCSELYRCVLPFGPWLRFFLFVNPVSNFIAYLFSIAYFSLKVGELYRYSRLVKKSAESILKSSLIVISSEEHETKECIVCCSELSRPIKLICKHVFCQVCIERWLDQNTTCPICRAEVAKDIDNEWKNGGTSLAIRLF